jgi:hypothetical protein
VGAAADSSTVPLAAEEDIDAHAEEASRRPAAAAWCSLRTDGTIRMVDSGE